MLYSQNMCILQYIYILHQLTHFYIEITSRKICIIKIKPRYISSHIDDMLKPPCRKTEQYMMDLDHTIRRNTLVTFDITLTFI